MKPLIGITLNLETRPEADGGYSDYPWYAMRREYESAVAAAGGMPVHIGYGMAVEDVLAHCDGLVLTGADLTSPPEAYTRGLTPTSVTEPRLAFELDLIRQAYDMDKPVLGICAGMQHMVLALGGTLQKDIDPIHKNLQRHLPVHEVTLETGSKLATAMDATQATVNSNHREAVQTIPTNLTPCATATDDLIEGVEAPEKNFFIGLQWHPEFCLTPAENQLWKAFIGACRP